MVERVALAGTLLRRGTSWDMRGNAGETGLPSVCADSVYPTPWRRTALAATCDGIERGEKGSDRVGVSRAPTGCRAGYGLFAGVLRLDGVLEANGSTSERWRGESVLVNPVGRRNDVPN